MSIAETSFATLICFLAYHLHLVCLRYFWILISFYFYFLETSITTVHYLFKLEDMTSSEEQVDYNQSADSKTQLWRNDSDQELFVDS